MIVLTLLAGQGLRFKNVGIRVPKPLVEVGTDSQGRKQTIIEMTTRSLPFIRHYDENTSPCIPEHMLWFAIQKKHNLDTHLKTLYGDSIKFVEFDDSTPGNLATAHLALHTLQRDMPETPLLLLDGDNKYNDNGLLTTILQLQRYPAPQMMCTYFSRLDENNKWAFAIKKNYRITDIVEKPEVVPREAVPLIGTFYFSSVRLFMEYAQKVFDREETINNEYYVSQVLKEYLWDGHTLQYHHVHDVHPLGTPEDVVNYVVKNKEKKV